MSYERCLMFPPSYMPRYTHGGSKNKRDKCSKCPPGSYCDGSSVQTLCVAGKYSPAGAALCTECGDTKSYSVKGASYCSTCVGGSQTSGPVGSSLLSACTACAAGSRCDGSSTAVGCTPGKYSPGGSATCLSCGEDNKYSFAGAAICRVCPVGSSTSDGTSTTRSSCELCTSGTPCDGSSSVVPCPAGKYAGAGAKCVSCGTDNKYADVGASGCKTCSAGLFTAGGTSQTRSTCSPCPAGSSCDGSSEIKQCAAGSFSEGGAGKCAACGLGYGDHDNQYAEAGANRCRTCAAGSFTEGGSSGQRTACKACAAGFVCGGDSTAVMCTSGKYSAPSSAACQDCGTANLFSRDAASACSKCDPGSYTTGGSSEKTRTQCTVCPAGYKCEGKGAREVCSAGHFSSSGSVDCQRCGADTQYSAAQSGTCRICPPGSVTSGGASDGMSRTTCTSCAAGSECKDGSSTTTQCAAGTFSKGGQPTCSNCGADNSYSNAAGSTSCDTCKASFYTTGGTSTTHTGCERCKAGMVCTGDSGPTACPTGTFSGPGRAPRTQCGSDSKFSAGGATSCSMCATGSITSGGMADGTTRTTCSPCPPGLACDGTSKSTTCTPGKYSPGSNNACLECGADNLYSGSGASSCSTCARGSYSSLGSSKTRQGCSQCPAGSFCTGESVQTPCPAGKFSGAGSADCSPCGDDNTWSSTGASKCPTCPPGSFTSGGSKLSREQCSVCPGGWACPGGSATSVCAAGTFSPGGAITCASCGADNSYSRDKASVCTTCGPGSITSGGTSANRTTCSPCGSGYQCDGTSIPTACAPGKFAAAGARACSECASDSSYSTRSASKACSICGPGMFTSGNNKNTRTTCAGCPAGSSCDGSSRVARCNAGSFSEASSSRCTGCNADTSYSGGGASACTSCPKGSFTSGGSTVSRTTCTSCVTGYQCDGGSKQEPCGDDSAFSPPGASVCTTCAAGMKTSGGASTTRTQCISCVAGYKCDGSSASTACTAGYYSPAKSPTCLTCGANHKYSEAVASSSCRTCKSGFQTTGGDSDGTTRTSCEVCPTGSTCTSGSVSSCSAGKYAAPGSSTCTACGDDKKYADVGASTCDTCPVGMFTGGGDVNTRSTCSVCPAGSYCADGSSIKALCEAGTFSTAGQAKCLGCGHDDQYATSKGAASCKVCPAGSLTGGGTSTTRTSCSPCSAGSKCSGSSIAAPCDAGQYSSAGKSTCLPCGFDNFFSSGGSSGCTKCSAATSFTSGGISSMRTSCSTCLAGKLCDGTRYGDSEESGDL